MFQDRRQVALYVIVFCITIGIPLYMISVYGLDGYYKKRVERRDKKIRNFKKLFGV